MKQETIHKLSWLALTLFVAFGLYMYFTWIKCPDWNEYWKEEFDKGQCEEICLENGWSFSGEDPDDCFCDRGTIEINRPLTARQSHVLTWCGWG